MTLSETSSRPRGPVPSAVISIGSFVALLWVIEIVDTILGHRLDGFGVRPWRLDGLDGILFAPLLHANWAHLVSNSGPLLVLGFVGMLWGRAAWWKATAVIWLTSGVGVWLTGVPGSLHIGASGVVFGWITFLVLRGVFTRKFLQIVVGVLVLLGYGGVLWGVFPSQVGVSWQAHLFGAVGGVIAAVMLRRSTIASAGTGVRPTR